MVPAARFTELLADIEPSPTTKERASSAHTAICKHLADHDCQLKLAALRTNSHGPN
jgi:hypothetical protein